MRNAARWSRLIVPVVLRRKLAYVPFFYAPLALLHLSLLWRFVAGAADAGMRAAVPCRLVAERHLSNTPSFGKGLNDDLLKDIEVDVCDLLFADDRRSIEAEPTR